jgi:hypothetical protein
MNMTEGITRESAERHLSDVTPMWRAFWFHPHLVAKNMIEFVAALKEIDDGVYLYHAEGHKNDLAKWIREVVGDGVLADELERVKTRDEAVQVCSNRIDELTGIIDRAQ